MHKLLFAFLLIPCLLSNAQPNTTISSGSIKGPFLWRSKIYPGTERNYWLYIPGQYTSTKAACLMVVQDGLSRAIGWRLPVVLDSLIAINEVPVMIGLFIDPGTVPSADTSNYPRFNRSFEYDALGDRYARFLLEELIPEVSRSYNISTNPNDRSIGGASSGAICAFNVAWERPDMFRRVFSSIGTYVGLRSGNEFPTLIRKTETKPLRIFLQDGTRDNNIYAGDWWVANQDMLSALTWAGYEVAHAWGEGGGHDSKHTITILPQALKWLWKDHPASINTRNDSIIRINPLLKDHGWEEIELKKTQPQKLAINQAGDLFFGDRQFIYKIDSSNTVTQFVTMSGNAGGMSFHRDGKLYVADLANHKIISLDNTGRQQDIIRDVNPGFLTTSLKGIYFTEAAKKRLGFYSFETKQVNYITMPGKPTGLAISADQTFISFGFEDLSFGYSFKILKNGTLSFGQEYIHYHLPYGSTSPGTTGLATDTSNLLYSATAAGIQMSDQLGRVNFIILKPADSVTDLKIGGKDFNILFANCNGRLFYRKLNTKGTLSWLPAVKPPKPRL